MADEQLRHSSDIESDRGAFVFGGGRVGAPNARRRDVSLHSRSVRGAQTMDLFTTLVQTSKKLGVNAYDYLRDRISR